MPERNLKKAIITNNEVRCPVCGRKHFEIHGNEIVKNLVVYCKGTRTNNNEKHYFLFDL